MKISTEDHNSDNVLLCGVSVQCYRMLQFPALLSSAHTLHCHSVHSVKLLPGGGWWMMASVASVPLLCTGYVLPSCQ